MTDKMLEAFDGTRKAGSIASGALDEITKIIKPGVRTDEIDNLCYEYINDNGAFSAPLFYRGFPKSCCTSPNHIVCHGIPKDKVLNEGDIVNVDVTALKNGWHGDTSRMFFVGEVSTKASKLVKTTYEAMIKSIDSTSDWEMYDNVRAGYNVDNNQLEVNDEAAQDTNNFLDLLSNGFKLRASSDPNVAETYIYGAWAHNSLKYATAR